MSKTTALMFRVTDNEKEALKTLAESNDVTVSELLRRFAREGISQGPSFFQEKHMNVNAMTRQLAAIGRNLNQIARRVNSGECRADPLSTSEIAELKTTVADTRGMLQTILANAKKRRVILRAAGRGKGL